VPAEDAPDLEAHHAEQNGKLEKLGLGPDAIAAVRAAVEQPHGLVLATGPAGSGRTTTLRTALKTLENDSREVVTIKSGASNGKALRTVLQSDPGILLIDDLGQGSTARLAVDAALRGHLVLSTLHAPSHGSALARLTAMGIDRQVLAATLGCVVGQRLARRLCPTCREPYEAGRSSLIAAGFADTYLPPTPFVGVHRARGCPECDRGYDGRIGLFEVLAVSAPIRRILETGAASDIDGAAAYGGTRTLSADGLRHCLAGRTTLDEVRRVVGARPA
jgi:general secretion pathway protein E